jgi:hypothetical protein
MAEPSAPAPDRLQRLTRVLLTPWFVLGLLVAVIAFGVLITPVQQMNYSYPRLTTYAAADGGAMGLYLAAERLGWDVDRLERPMRRGADSTVVYAVLQPPEPLTSSDVSALLGAVADGAGLLAVLDRDSALGDSLGVKVHRRPVGERRVALAGPLARARPDLARRTARDTSGADDDDADEAAGDPDAERPSATRVLEFSRAQSGITRLLTLPRTADSSAAETRDPRDTTSTATVAAAFAYGQGRVVVVADPRILRNSVLEETYGGIIAIRLLQQATPEGVSRLIFDEYHFGYGQRSTLFGLLGRALFGTRAGRLTLQVALAALILLLAVAPRAITPRPSPSIERRSPLEHVGALARAYEQIAATQTAMRRLLRGVRRRHTPLGSSLGDEDYLEALAQRHPESASDVAIIRNALQRPLSSEELSGAAQALERLEHTVYPTSELVRT